jgi:hypothetical protein
MRFDLYFYFTIKSWRCDIAMYCHSKNHLLFLKRDNLWSLEKRPGSQIWKFSEKHQEGELPWWRTQVLGHLNPCTVLPSRASETQSSFPQESMPFSNCIDWHPGPGSPVHFSSKALYVPIFLSVSWRVWLSDRGHWGPGQHRLLFLPVMGMRLQSLFTISLASFFAPPSQP